MTLLSPGGPEEWGREIRGWLLGRLGRGTTAGAAPATEAVLENRALAWWIFEGKWHRYLDGPLAARTMEAEREARRLDAVLSPEWRVEDSPAAETDWVRTALNQPMEPGPRFVVRASSSGLTDAERQALRGWRRYTAHLWRTYTAALGVPAGAPARLPWDRDEPGEPTLRELHRWAQAARRSRWPLLREVVAESLRAAVEPESIDRLPLPGAREAVFELLCVVRILDALAGPSRVLRLLGNGDEFKGVRLAGLTCDLQGGPAGKSLSDEDLGVACVRALERHGVNVPNRYDALVTFEEPRAGFSGILLEAKSGAQSFTDTVYQLKSYRAALRKTHRGAFLIWGVVEGGGDRKKEFDPDALRKAAMEREEGDDLWLFTSEDEIRAALEATLLMEPEGEEIWALENLDEDRIFGACALRFDGYRWLDDRAREGSGGLEVPDFNKRMSAFLEDFFSRENYDRPPEELFFVFFMIQRLWIKEGWLHEDEQLARVTRRLFLETCHKDPPAAYWLNDYPRRWQVEFAPRLAMLVEFVKWKDAKTVYESTPILVRHFRGGSGQGAEADWEVGTP